MPVGPSRISGYRAVRTWLTHLIRAPPPGRPARQPRNRTGPLALLVIDKLDPYDHPDAEPLMRSVSEAIGQRAHGAAQPPGTVEAVEVSIGWAARSPNAPATVDDLVHQADRAMYQAKAAKRSG